MLDLIIRSDRVVTPHGVGEYEIGIQGEQVVSVAVPGAVTQEAGRVIDARGKIVVPGGVEPHDHTSMKIPSQAGPYNLFAPSETGQTSQKPSGASRACAFGGTTTVVDFAVSGPSRDPLTAVAEKKKEWAGNSYVDYSLHCTLPGEPPPEYLAQIPEVISQGIPSIKCYTRGRRPLYDPPSQVDEGYLYEVMTIVAQHGGIMVIHAENDAIISYMREKLKREGRVGFENIHLVHNNLSEDIEFRKVIRLAEQAGAAVYLLHVSAKEGVAAVAEARAKGLPIYGETLHCYTAFSCEKYKEPDGVKYHTYPSLKYPEDRDALWAAVLDGRLSIVATDDVTTSLEVKLRGKTIFDARGGHNGLETRLAYVFSEGVSKGKMSLQRFVDLTSANPAKILGMYPRKGAIAPGSDADIAIIDPNIKKKVKVSDLHSDSDFSIWEGWEFRGWPMVTILRGKVIVEGGKLLGGLSDGKFVARKIAPEVLDGPAC